MSNIFFIDTQRTLRVSERGFRNTSLEESAKSRHQTQYEMMGIVSVILLIS